MVDMTLTKIIDDDGGIRILGTEYLSAFAKILFPSFEDFYDRHNQSFLAECIKSHRDDSGDNTVMSLILRVKGFVPEVQAASYDELWTEEEDQLLKMSRAIIISKLEQLPNNTQVWSET